MIEKQKQEWITPELVEYGDVARLTATSGKNFCTGDGQGQGEATCWLSGTKPGN